MIDRLLPYINSNLFPWLVSSAILCFALLLWLYFRFKHLAPIIKELNHAIDTIEQGPADSFNQQFVSIDEKLKQLPRIQHQWFVFKQYLHIGTTEHDEVTTIYYSRSPQYFFNTQSLIADKINLRFYQTAPNLFIQLGLFFTFLGLLTALYVVSDGLMASELAELKLSLQELLKAATFKFLTSLTAIFAAIIYGWREKALWHQMQILISHFNLALETRLSVITTSPIIKTSEVSSDDHPLQTRYQVSNTPIQHHHENLENFDNQFLIAINLGFSSIKKEVQRLNTGISVATQRLYKAIHLLAEQTENNKNFDSSIEKNTQQTDKNEDLTSASKKRFSHEAADKINELLNKP